MAASPRRSVEIDSALLERARRAARERGVAVPQLVSEALEHELGEEADTSVEAILARHGESRLSPEEFNRHFGDLPTDGEG
jgi:hypothetical protein